MPSLGWDETAVDHADTISFKDTISLKRAAIGLSAPERGDPDR
jgi:hypothetical protein